MTMEYMRTAWNTYRKNISALIGGFVVWMVIVMAIFAIGIAPIAASLISYFTGGGQFTLEVLLDNIQLFLFALLMMFIAGFVSVALQGGYIKMCAEALRKKTSINTMLSTARIKASTLIGAKLLAAIISIVLLLLSFITIILVIPVAIALAVFFMFIEQAVVIDNKKAVDAVKHSFNFTKANFIDVLLLVLVIFVISIIVSLIPIIGTLITFFVITPVSLLAYTSLYMKKRKKRY